MCVITNTNKTKKLLNVKIHSLKKEHKNGLNRIIISFNNQEITTIQRNINPIQHRGQKDHSTRFSPVPSESVRNSS